ncbi:MULTISPECIES: glycerol kinase GlpK [Asticcacaulis]|uniref:glycerol kinase GlpK n=1 Tax=Asticcacaulis TaxID=76890 RepID=UPI001AE424EA|nr:MULTISPECIES: glycerol kinase GlpK [Asticcacaulis]MBP2159296.1 glycerol kinase [Asticcacaulis solisilvae]MDR6800341.1 glycerol kinase [Asticcacaulis sp. BE141]
MPEYILAFDQGTTSSRAIVFDRDGNICRVAQKEFRQIFPQPGLVEHDAREIWSTQIGVAGEALAGAGLKASDIAAIGVTNQRETTVIWDRATGKPIHNAIVWQDRRTAADCEALRAAGHEPTFQTKTGLLLDSYFSGTKVRWLLDNIEGAREKAECGELAFGTIDSWLVWNLTGGELHITDASNASRTLMYDIHTGQWDDELLRILNVPRSLLPEVRANSEVYGRTAEGLLGARIPIAGMAGDQQAATFGQICTQRGMAKNTYGTGCFMLMNTANEAVPSRNKLLTTLAWEMGEKRTYALEGSVFIAGAAVQWLRDGLGIIRSSSEIEPLARSVEASDGVYFVPAFVGLGTPHWDPHARGTLLGLTRGSTKAHIARATLEAVAFQSAEVLEAMQADSGIALQELRVDGGGSANNLTMQFQADILGVPVVRPKIIETTALGAAYLAGLAVGYWDSPDSLASQWQVDRRFEPNMGVDERTERMSRWREAVRRSAGWAQ